MTALANAVSAWYRIAARDLPWRRPDVGAWGVLVSEVMLQQTPVARVLPVWAEWMARWPGPSDLAAETPGEAVRAWGRLGYPRRALRLHSTACVLVERHDGRVPDDVGTLLTLPGIGTYTARAVAAFAYGQRHAVVDANVRRVVARAVEGRAEPPPSVGAADLRLVESLLPDAAAEAAHASAALMELGALVCTARSPRCGDCPVAGACAWRLAGRPPHDGPGRRGQPYAGTDRQVRGRLLAVLRDSQHAVGPERLIEVWDDDAQRDRALAGLLADGLAVEAPGGYALP